METVMDVPDSELMARLAAGDDLALNVLMNRWSERVVAFLFRMTGQRETAIDLAQETFVKLYQARVRYRPQGNFSTWLFAIAVNLARNRARWKARHPTVSLDVTNPDGSAAFPDPVDPEQTPQEAVLTRETTAAVNLAILSLPLDLREALTLFIYEGMSYAEIAEISHCSQKSVETRIYRARQILKVQLKDLRS
jgi:RNA polymerase sigma-70 factor (ECF subfamily)